MVISTKVDLHPEVVYELRPYQGNDLDYLLYSKDNGIAFLVWSAARIPKSATYSIPWTSLVQWAQSRSTMWKFTPSEITKQQFWVMHNLCPKT